MPVIVTCNVTRNPNTISWYAKHFSWDIQKEAISNIRRVNSLEITYVDVDLNDAVFFYFKAFSCFVDWYFKIQYFFYYIAINL